MVCILELDLRINTTIIQLYAAWEWNLTLCHFSTVRFLNKKKGTILKRFLYGLFAYVSLNHFYTWMFSRKDCRGQWFLPNGLLQCVLLWHCPCPLFHALYTYQLFEIHQHNCFGFSPSKIEPVVQVHLNPQKSDLTEQLCSLYLTHLQSVSHETERSFGSLRHCSWMVR